MKNENSKISIILLVIILVLLIFVVFFVTKKADAPIINNDTSVVDTKVLGNSNDLVSLSIIPGEKVSGILTLTGSIKGGYFFEGNILVNILDVQKNVLMKSNGTVTTSWTTSEPVSFRAILDISNLPKGRAYIEIHNDNASGLSENDKSILVPIIIN